MFHHFATPANQNYLRQRPLTLIGQPDAQLFSLLSGPYQASKNATRVVQDELKSATNILQRLKSDKKFSEYVAADMLDLINSYTKHVCVAASQPGKNYGTYIACLKVKQNSEKLENTKHLQVRLRCKGSVTCAIQQHQYTKLRLSVLAFLSN